ncbi:MAG TPA: S1 family peptidase [Solirubrobacteraceae bacterium]|jgi:hypothetical protein|nr:S1 family peptidase [Solirubrobacteraceae bacterium]
MEADRTDARRLALVVALAAALMSPGAANAALDRDAPVPDDYVQRFSAMRNIPADEARRTLQVQQRGYDLGDVLPERLGDDYAGVWFDQDAGRYKVPLAGGRGRERVRQALVARGLDGDADVVAARHPFTELTAEQRRLTALLDDLLAARKLLVGIDSIRNVVAVEVSDELTVGERRRVDAAAAASGGAAVVRTAEGGALDADAQTCVFRSGWASGCHRPFRMGVSIFSWSNPSSWCTAGAKAADGRGNVFVLTAGHCVRSIGEWGAFDPGQPDIWTQSRYLGWSSGYLYNGYGDGGRVHVRPDSWWNVCCWPHSHVGWGMYDYRTFQAKARPQPGQVGCHQGATGGSHCGTVDLVNTGVTYSDGTTLGNMTRWRDSCGLGGDSGGPWEWAWVHYGLHSGGNACGSSGTTYSYSFDTAHAEFALGVTVLIGS